MAREGVFGLVEVPNLPPGPKFTLKLVRIVERRNVANTEAGARISTALHRLGPSYVKLGQFLATRPDLVGMEVAEGLRSLQDRLPPFPREEALDVVEESFDRPATEIFSQFGDSVAAASIAQVHAAEIQDPDGNTRKVAVKVLRPGINARFRRDLRSYYLAARFVERFHIASRRLRPVAVVDTLARSVELEMDLRLEAAALSEMAENIQNDSGFRVPKVDWAKSSKSVLTMEWIEGRKLSDLDGLKDDGQDKKQIAANIIQSFLQHALRDGFFHADMHQGNLFIEQNGTIAAVDFGIMGRLGIAERRFLAEILFGFITRNYQRVAEVHFEAGYVPSNQDTEIFAQAIRAIGEPIHGHSASEISMARLLTQLFEVTELFDMQTQTQLIMLQKTMVVVEGVARTLDPELDIWHTAEPVVRNYLENNLGPSRRIQDAASSLNAIGGIISEFPKFVDRTNRISNDLEGLARNGFKLDDESVNAIGEAEARHSRSGRIALWIIAISLAVVAIGVLN